MPQAKIGSTVFIHYTLTTKTGQIVQSTAGGDPARIAVGAGKLLRGIEEALEGMSPGESKRVTIPAKKGFGAKRPGAVVRESLETEAPLGSRGGVFMKSVDNPGTQEERTITVTDKGMKVEVGTHLAGEELVADIDLVDIES